MSSTDSSQPPGGGVMHTVRDSTMSSTEVQQHSSQAESTEDCEEKGSFLLVLVTFLNDISVECFHCT